MARVILKDVGKHYSGNSEPTLQDINIVVEDGQFLVLLGPSGCGKSTLLRMIAGLETITKGEITIGERVINQLPARDRDIAMVFQNYALFPHLNVFDNIAFGLKIRKVPATEIKKRVEEAAAILGLEQLLTKRPKQLSGGQCQRVAVGRAIVRQPKVFLFDEPLSNLDAKLRVQMRTEIKRLHKHLQATMIYVTHDQVEAMTMGDKIALLHAGKVQQCDTPLAIYNNPANLFVAGFLGSPPMNLIAGAIEKDHEDYYFVGAGIRAELPTRPEFGDYLEQAVTLGVRPEHVYARLDTPPQVNTCGFFSAEIELVEALGPELCVYFKLGEQNLIGRLNPKTEVKPLQRIELAFDRDQLHLFAPDGSKIGIS